MQIRRTPPYGETTWLTWRMHFTTWVMFSAVTLAAILAVHMMISVELHPEDYIKVPIITVLLYAGVFAAMLMERGYRIAYDDAAIYLRPPGFTWRLKRHPFQRMPFDEIALVTGERGSLNISYGNKFTPFQYARIYRQHTFYDAEFFALIGAELRNDEFRDLLWLINEKAPGTLDEDIIAFLESDRKF